jgi:hypothetical protein
MSGILDPRILPFRSSEDMDMKDMEEQVVERIRKEWGQEQYPAELIQRVEGILDVNAVEHRYAV